MEINLNDQIRNLYDWHVEDWIAKDGGGNTFELLFDTIEIKLMCYQKLQRTFFDKTELMNKVLDLRLLLPCCESEASNPVLSDEDADWVENLMNRQNRMLSCEEFESVLRLSLNYSLPDHLLYRILGEEEWRYSMRDNGYFPYQAKTVCRKKLQRVYPSAADLIYDHTFEAVGLYMEAVDQHVKQLRRFLNAVDDPQADAETVNNLDMIMTVLSMIPKRSDRREVDETGKLRTLLEIIWEKDEEFPWESCKEVEMIPLWDMITHYRLSAYENDQLFSRILRSVRVPKESLFELFLSDFCSLSPELEERLCTDKHTLQNTFLNERPAAESRLESSLFKNEEGNIYVARRDIRLLFLNILPETEDEGRKILNKDETAELIQILNRGNRYFPGEEVHKILSMARTGRLPLWELLRWTLEFYREEDEPWNICP